jgi:uncharacterized membrane protein YeaQ/YmgE (transglycosylase-associated protein family)
MTLFTIVVQCKFADTEFLFTRASKAGGALKVHILWIILIGFVAGIIAKLITPGDNEPQGFILTTILGIVGAFVATYLGQAIGWYGPDQGAGLIGGVVGAALILLVWGLIQRNRSA